jgi:putative DNA primase/helicase
MAKSSKPVKKDAAPMPAADDVASLPFNPDDDQLATYIAKAWNNKAAYFRSNWYVYESGCWVSRDTRQLRTRIRRQLAQEREYLPKGVSQARINAISNMLEDDLYIPDRKVSERELESASYVNLQNGLFNLDTFKLEEHRAELYLTNQLDFAYDDNADAPNFRKFLRTSLTGDDGQPDQDMIALTHELMAYSMTARTDLKSSAWLVGAPDSGKSTLIAFLRSLMGSLHATIDLNQLATNRFLLAGIVGKRVVTFTEADTTAFLPDALYKAMVGGTDEIYVDVKNKPGISFVPTAKFWWAMNGAPRINDRSGATFNRLQVIHFDKTVPREKRIANLSALLNSEKPGVFNILIAAYRRLVTSGKFTKSDRSEKWREQYQRENDTEMLYATENLDYKPTDRLGGQELYDNYANWCQRAGFKPKNITQVAKEWRRIGLADRRIDGKTYWMGATFKGVNINAK